jgi:hypothetical protein
MTKVIQSAAAVGDLAGQIRALSLIGVGLLGNWVVLIDRSASSTKPWTFRKGIRTCVSR